MGDRKEKTGQLERSSERRKLKVEICRRAEGVKGRPRQAVSAGVVAARCAELTWIKAVEMMIPVPNCLSTVSTTLLGDMNFQAKIGEKTPAIVSHG